MTDHDLATLVREHVTRDEPPFLMSAGTAIAVGRRALVRRRARRGLAGVLVAAAAMAAVPLMPWHGSAGGGVDKTGIDPLTAAALENYDAQKMPAVLDEHVRVALGHGLDGLGQPEFSAGDSAGESLPPKYYDKASSMDVEYGGDGDRQVRASLMHSRSEAEGDARRNCANDVDQGYAFSCTVTTGANGDIVTTRVMAMRRLDEPVNASWGALTREELRTGIPAKGDPSQQPIDPDEVYFRRSVESVHSNTFLSTASETVRAPDLATAQSLWKIPAVDLETIVTDPALVIPEPPLDEDGCPWTLSDDISCSRASD